MKRIGTMLGILAVTAALRVEAQAQVSVSVGVAAPHVSGYVVVGDPYAYRSGVVVIGAGRPRVHRSRVLIIQRGYGYHKHRHHHRHYRRGHGRVVIDVGACGGGYGCR